MGDVVLRAFKPSDVVEEAPETLLEEAKSWGLRQCIVIGQDRAGKFWRGSSTSDGNLINYLLDIAKRECLDTMTKDKTK